jgi:hypothetical protein
MSLFILVGNMYSYFNEGGYRFAIMSFFQAMATSTWMAHLLSANPMYQNDCTFEFVLWLFWTGGVVNWIYIMKNAQRLKEMFHLKKIFPASYYDTLYIVSSLVYIFNDCIYHK